MISPKTTRPNTRRQTAFVAQVVMFALLLLSVSYPQNAFPQTILIDDFSSDGSISSVALGQTQSINISAPQAIGSNRALKITLNDGIEASALCGGGLLYHSSYALSNGTSEVVWDGDSTAANLNINGLHNLNLHPDSSRGFRFLISYFSYEGGNSVTLTLTAYDGSDPTAKTYSRAQTTITRTMSSQVVLLPFSAFTMNGPSGAANFSSIGALSLKITNSQSYATSFAISNLEVGCQILGDCPTPTPLPTVAATITAAPAPTPTVLAPATPPSAPTVGSNCQTRSTEMIRNELKARTEKFTKTARSALVKAFGAKTKTDPNLKKLVSALSNKSKKLSDSINTKIPSIITSCSSEVCAKEDISANLQIVSKQTEALTTKGKAALGLIAKSRNKKLTKSLKAEILSYRSYARSALQSLGTVNYQCPSSLVATGR